MGVEMKVPSNKEGQEDQLGALGLVVNAIVLWNTRYMDAVLSQLQADGDAIADADARRLSPLVHKHLNFLGRYHFSLPGDVRGGVLRELRDPNAGLEEEWLLRSAALSVHSCSVATQTPVSPAHAGMYPRTFRWRRARRSFPRTRGDVPGDAVRIPVEDAFPPHTRGCTFGTTPQVWLNLQKTYELRRAEIKAGHQIAERVRPRQTAA